MTTGKGGRQRRRRSDETMSRYCPIKDFKDPDGGAQCAYLASCQSDPAKSGRGRHEKPQLPTKPRCVFKSYRYTNYVPIPKIGKDYVPLRIGRTEGHRTSLAHSNYHLWNQQDTTLRLEELAGISGRPSGYHQSHDVSSNQTDT